MKILHFKKEQDSRVYCYQNYSANCFYIPDKKAILTKIEPVLGTTSYIINNKKEDVEEAEAIEKGQRPNKSDLTFSQIKRVYYNGSSLQYILKLGQEGLESCIEELLEQIK